MNTYYKLMTNVFLAKCEEKHDKGDVITVTSRRGNESEYIVYNLVLERDGYFFYSILRKDGLTSKDFAEMRAEKFKKYADKAAVKSYELSETSSKMIEAIPPGQPILVGHHSERGHRKALERSDNMMSKAIELEDKAKEYERKVEYWNKRVDDINLSMPESIEFYEFKLEEAEKRYQGLKDGTIEREHAHSLSYARREVNDMKKKLNVAKALWG